MMNAIPSWIRKNKSVRLCYGLVVPFIVLLLLPVWFWQSPSVLVGFNEPVVTVLKNNFDSVETKAMLTENSSYDVIRFPLDFEKMARHLETMLKIPSDITLVNFSRPCLPDGDPNGDQTACKSNCSRPLSNSPKVRLWDLVMSSKLTLSDEQMDTILTLTEMVPTSDYTIISASSADHFQEMQSMFYNLHTRLVPHLHNFSVLLFDIGLTAEQRKMTELNCRCRVLDFPFSKFPRHTANRNCYSWKPLIVLAAFQKTRKALIYQDNSIRWLPAGWELLSRTENLGIQLFCGSASARISLHTLEKTFDYFEEKPCAFSVFPEVRGTMVMFRRDAFAVNAILKPWARCALETSCMCPVLPKTVLGCPKILKDHRCHRFDQSVLGIITGKLFNEELYKFTVPSPRYVDIKRFADHPDYFNST